MDINNTEDLSNMLNNNYPQQNTSPVNKSSPSKINSSIEDRLNRIDELRDYITKMNNSVAKFTKIYIEENRTSLNNYIKENIIDLKREYDDHNEQIKNKMKQITEIIYNNQQNNESPNNYDNISDGEQNSEEDIKQDEYLHKHLLYNDEDSVISNENLIEDNIENKEGESIVVDYISLLKLILDDNNLFVDFKYDLKNMKENNTICQDKILESIKILKDKIVENSGETKYCITKIQKLQDDINQNNVHNNKKEIIQCKNKINKLLNQLDSNL